MVNYFLRCVGRERATLLYMVVKEKVGLGCNEQEGVGIGLYLSRQITSGEGGYIKVASIPEKGSTFSVFLPK